MNAKHGQPAGTVGTITFTTGTTRVAVKTPEGVCYINVQGALWLACDPDAAALFVEA